MKKIVNVMIPAIISIGMIAAIVIIAKVIITMVLGPDELRDWVLWKLGFMPNSQLQMALIGAGLVIAVSAITSELLFRKTFPRKEKK